MFMSVLSITTLGSTLPEMLLNLLLAAVLWVIGHYCFQLVTKINAVHEYMIKSIANSDSIDKDIKRIEHETEISKNELRQQIENLDKKFDRIIAEIKADRKTT